MIELMIGSAASTQSRHQVGGLFVFSDRANGMRVNFWWLCFSFFKGHKSLFLNGHGRMFEWLNSGGKSAQTGDFWENFPIQHEDTNRRVNTAETQLFLLWHYYSYYYFLNLKTLSAVRAHQSSWKQNALTASFYFGGVSVLGWFPPSCVSAALQSGVCRGFYFYPFF